MSKVRHRGTVKQVIFTSIISLCQQARNSGVWFSIFYILYIACLYVHVIKQDKLKAEDVRYRQCLESSLFSGILYIFNKLSFTVATVGNFSDFLECLSIYMKEKTWNWIWFREWIFLCLWIWSGESAALL